MVLSNDKEIRDRKLTGNLQDEIPGPFDHQILIAFFNDDTQKMFFGEHTFLQQNGGNRERAVVFYHCPFGLLLSF
jgi:hypothetical protein